jgi:hypothetical protein
MVSTRAACTPSATVLRVAGGMDSGTSMRTSGMCRLLVAKEKMAERVAAAKRD